MSKDYPQAISFANSYFSLVDGLAPGLDHHLADNVVLDWFGHAIRGRDNVTGFMKAHKIATRHVFPSIEPVAGMNYKKFHTPKTRQDSRRNDNNLRRQLNFERLSIHDEVDPENNNVIKTEPMDSLDTDDADPMSYELNENDLAKLFALEITPNTAKEIQDNIQKLKREESSGNRFVLKRDYNEGDGLLVLESTSIKYVEANGQIEFYRKSSKRGTEFHKWRRQSKIQIAYSVTKREACPNFDNEHLHQNQDSNENVEHDLGYWHPDAIARNIIDELDNQEASQGPESSENPENVEPDHQVTPRICKTLPTFEEIIGLGCHLVPNINNFGGYQGESRDFFEDREAFLDKFHAELALKNALKSVTPQYVNNRLVFGQETDNSSRKEDSNGFVFNYKIHLIIYEGRSRCRRSLTEEFDTDQDVKRRAIEA